MKRSKIITSSKINDVSLVLYDLGISQCHFFVFTECPKGKFGHKCQFNCTCENNARCDHITGRCRCTAGWTGSNCEKRK